MKRLIAILATLFLGSAMAQELVPPTPVSMETGNIIYTTLNPPPEGTQYTWTGFISLNTGGGGLQGGNIPAYNSETGTFIWGYGQGTVTYNFYGNSFWPSDGIMVNGFKYSWEYFNQDLSRGFLTGNVTFFGNGNNVLESYNFAFPQTTEGWTLLSGQIDFETPYDRSKVDRLQLSFTGVDDRFWAGYYGPQIRDLDVSILYSEGVPPPIAPDCTINPNDPTCIIQDLTTFSTDEILALTDTTTDTGDNGSDDGSEPIVEEEEETIIADETVDETNIEETLQDEETSSDEEVVVAEANEREVTYRELSDEEKASILADAISKNTLELALSVAETAATTTATATSETVATTTSRTTTVIEDTVDKTEDNKNDNDEQVADSNTDTANDLLENGRQLNNVSMTMTQSQTEQTASDSINQAESIAMSSSEIKGSESIIESITIDNVIDNSSNASNNGSEVELIAEQSKVETVIEEVVADNIEQNVEASTQTIDSFSDIMNIEIKPTDTSTDDVEFVQNVLAQLEQKSEDTNISAFEEDEKVTIQNDPNLSNAFNVVPNTTNLEILGVINNKQDEKSDAEKRAEQVVAANKEQQDEINKNYMDADQSGIVAAMGADTDVGSYRSAMLNDNNIWYKPEDIYKNVVYKDNVRGSYFLEKGNTDTYKKMVEDQYK